MTTISTTRVVATSFVLLGLDTTKPFVVVSAHQEMRKVHIVSSHAEISPNEAKKFGPGTSATSSSIEQASWYGTRCNRGLERNPRRVRED